MQWSNGNFYIIKYANKNYYDCWSEIILNVHMLAESSAYY